MNPYKIIFFTVLPLLMLSASCTAPQPLPEIRGQLLGATVTAQIDLPLRLGMVVYANGEIDFAVYRSKLAASGISIRRYDRARITNLESDGSKLLVRLNMGGKGKGSSINSLRWTKPAQMNRMGTTIHIEYNHTLSGNDIRPERVAYALRDVLKIRGVPSSPVATPAVQKSTSSTSTGAKLLSVEARPSRVMRGQSLSLNVHFEMEGATNANPANVTISRQIYKGEKPLFSTPRTQQGSWSAGIHSAEFSLTVPQKTVPGVYRFEASLSCGGNTFRREVLFEVK